MKMTLNELRDRLKPPCPVLDIHAHPLWSGPVSESVPLLVEGAKRAGVVKICVSTLRGGQDPSVTDCRQSNDYTLAVRDAAPDVFIPFCYVNPKYPDEALAEMERCVVGERMCGIKLWTALRTTDPGLDPIMEKVAELGIPVLQHAWDKTTGNLPNESFPADVADLARRHPKARIIMAHLNGAGLRGIEEVADCPNLYVDTSGGDPESGMVEATVAALGWERIVYGSDVTGRHFAVQMGKTLGTDLPDSVKKDILWNNAARLLPAWAGVKPLEGGAA
jgi:predicted TIM-barrel fold metal-dependent hydrolase